MSSRRRTRPSCSSTTSTKYEQLATVRSMDHDTLVKNAVSTVRTVTAFMAFVAVDAFREGNEAYPVVDAIGGPSIGARLCGGHAAGVVHDPHQRPARGHRPFRL